MKSWVIEVQKALGMTGRTGKRAKRALSRGVTLIEILIVLAIIGLIAGGVAVVAVPQFEKARVTQAKQDVGRLQQAVELWRSQNPGGECPTMDKLKGDKIVAASTKPADPWDTAYEIVCEPNETVIISYGPDKKKGTTDDSKIPETSQQ
ncbi:MAG: type II secretion system protein GspG [Polyangiaceae bacterium]